MNGSAIEALLRPFADCNRFLWNKSVVLRKESVDNKQCCLFYSRLCNLLPSCKKGIQMTYRIRCFIVKLAGILKMLMQMQQRT